MSTRVVVCCGHGGVGKTTISAAVALGLALRGERVAVLTIDPARRLADALGVDILDNLPQLVDLGNLGLSGTGTLHALMLDRKATWDEVVRRYSPSSRAAEALFANQYYHAVSTRLSGSQEYMANEKLYELVTAERWDTVIIDTPPAQQTVEFFDAPERMWRVFDQRVLEILINPGRGLLSKATRRVVELVQRLAGATVMGDISEFFSLTSVLSSGFRERHRAVHDLLHDRARTGYYLVMSAANPKHGDALDFLGVLRERGMRFDGFLVNRAAAPVELSRPLAGLELPGPPPGVESAAWARGMVALGQLAEDRIALTERERVGMLRLRDAAYGAPLWAVPELTRTVRSVETLAQLSRHLPPTAEPLYGQGLES